MFIKLKYVLVIVEIKLITPLVNPLKRKNYIHAFPNPSNGTFTLTDIEGSAEISFMIFREDLCFLIFLGIR